ncbi:DUF3592 domain-containing protein [Maribacter forsetii]|uniref:DUF3592 domain-containing protein n=1 Tax=Maribacter forsetii TaxID=444515 RepID=UPI00056251DC|nr:DUF3592 domain-containing protein [Maribacter forsetii]
MIITLIIGVTVFLLGMLTYILDISSKKWNQTTGTITHAELKEKIYTDSDGSQQISYKADFEYIYQLNGTSKQMIGTHLFPYVDMWTPYKKEKLAFVEKLKKGNKVKVFYNPRNPSKSCLITGSNYYVKYSFSAGLAFITFALVFWIYELSEDFTLVLNQIMEK